MNILGIETSCDETCAAVVGDAQRVRSNVVASSLAAHALFGGVIPEIASRAHLQSICPVVDEALRQAKVSSKKIDAIAVTDRPGLIGSLLVGISFAQALGLAWKKPLMLVDHVRAHLYASFIAEDICFPFVGLVVSGGHTSLFQVKSIRCEKLIGATKDDAAGEAFDKVAKILGLGYPGGPAIEERAKKGRPEAYLFRCECGRGLDFSFSGIKTAVLYKVTELKKMYGRLTNEQINDICASFQAAVVEDLVGKSMRAAQRVGAKALAVGGGVAFNNTLRDRFASVSQEAGIRLFLAPKSYCLDNAAMVASLGARIFKKKLRR